LLLPEGLFALGIIYTDISRLPTMPGGTENVHHRRKVKSESLHDAKREARKPLECRRIQQNARAIATRPKVASLRSVF